MRFERVLNLSNLLDKKSFFLYGPRGTGKTSLIRSQLTNSALVIDLLKSDIYLRLSSSPHELEPIIEGSLQKNKKIIVIDEVQKLPILLDEVHRLIEEKKWTFLLTGSSARKLKRGRANLLGGRARVAELFPLVSAEIPNFKLDTVLRFGTLPLVYLSEAPEEDLHAYVRNYLYEEIQSEGLVRQLPPFSRFLTSAALNNGQLLNFANVASDSGVSPSTVAEYYQILTDTLIGHLLEPWTKSKKRKAIATAKFYFFDTGVTHALAGTKNLERNSDLYGRSFEQWIGNELRAYLSYLRINEPLNFWRSTHDFEVDYLIGDHTAIEVKSSKKVSPRDLKGLQKLKEERIFKQFFLVSQDPISARYEGIECLPWKLFCSRLWGDDLIKK